MKNNLLKINNLKVNFQNGKKKLTAVNGVSLSLDRGKVLGLVGESACGKSITALSVLRLLPPGGKVESGEVLLAGENLLALSPAEMRQVRGKRISMIFQDPAMALNPIRTVGSQFRETLKVRLGLNVKAAQEKAIAQLAGLELARPETILKQFPFQLSGGMRQRAMIAIALALDPDILIADEPTTALDVTVQAQILTEINKLKNSIDAGVLLISHNMGVIAQLADRVAVMYAGAIVEEGPAVSLFSNPAHPYTQALLKSIPYICCDNHRLHTIEGQPPLLNALPSGCSFAPRCERARDICHNKLPHSVAVGEKHSAACFFPLKSFKMAANKCTERS